MRKAEATETSEDEDRLAELEEKIAALRMRKADLNREVERWKADRDRFNELARQVRMEANSFRDERDRSNQRIADIRNRMEYLQSNIAEKRNRLTEFDASLDRERRKLPLKQDVEERLSRIEWEMMTTPTIDILEREKGLMEEAKTLKEELALHEELEDREDEMLVLQAEIKAAELEMRDLRDDISRMRETSKLNHERMILLHRKADEERARGDEAHSKFLDSLSEVRSVDEELGATVEEARGLRERLREVERALADEKERELEMRKKVLLGELKRKLDAGEKLSLDELKLLYSDDEDESQPQDQ